jgi:two-component system, NarL family, sensor histidine kinase UhpB
MENLIRRNKKKANAAKNVGKPDQRFRHIFDHSPAMVYFSDKNGLILDVNEAGIRMLGYSNRDEVVGLLAARSIYADPKDRKRFQKTIEQMGAIQDFETQFHRRDGTIIDVRITSTVSRNHEGEIDGYEGFVIDVTDRKQSERALKDSEEKYRTVVESSLSAIVIHQGGIFKFVNQRCAEMLGYDRPEELIGRRFWEVVHPEDREMVRRRGVRREKSQIFPLQYAIRAVKKDGSTIWCDMRATHATYMGNPAVVANFIDITQSKIAAEEISHLSRRLIEVSEDEKKRLAADLHDEFGQTLTSLHFDLEDLQTSLSKEITEKRNKCASLIQKVEMLADSVRKTTSSLRPDLLDHVGLVPAMEWYIHEFTERWPKIAVDFQVLGLKKRIRPDIELILYRICQESFNNIAKHAKANKV